jgi:GxxExxY protein
MKHEEITHKIIGCAFKVHNTLGFGFLESIYKKAMVVEFTRLGLTYEVEKPLKVHYDEKIVGDFYIDLLVENEIIVELKSVQGIAKEHEVQLVNYLNGMKIDLGLLINFGPTGVAVKRKYRKPV